ncbi:MAG TPA: EthD family reductase [Candidatus Dormibacteraeota bacterium]|nr:EthD family reductase [Candidatus Dormibacteraeota bacterium]
MLKLVVAYKKPKDAKEFERLYQEEHLPLAARIPHVSKIGLGKVAGTPDGSQAPYYRLAELYFEDQATLNRALSSEDGQKAARHAVEIATGGVDMIVVEVERDS